MDQVFQGREDFDAVVLDHFPIIRDYCSR